LLAQDPRTERFALRPDVVATLLDEGAVLLDLESKYFYRLNRTGWQIAQCFESGATLDEVKAYCRALGASPNDDAAIGAVLDVLTQDRLVEASVDAAADSPSVPANDAAAPWSPPTIEKQAEPLQRVIISAFDPSVPLVE
jgi:hypothetical protein